MVESAIYWCQEHVKCNRGTGRNAAHPIELYIVYIHQSFYIYQGQMMVKELAVLLEGQSNDPSPGLKVLSSVPLSQSTWWLKSWLFYSKGKARTPHPGLKVLSSVPLSHSSSTCLCRFPSTLYLVSYFGANAWPQVDGFNGDWPF